MFLPGAEFEGENYVALNGKQLSASEVVPVAARVGASFVSVTAVPFDLNGLVAELVGDDEDLPDAVKRVVAPTARWFHGGCLDNMGRRGPCLCLARANGMD